MTIKKVKIILDKRAKLPEQGTTGSAGYDITATNMDFLPVERCWVYETGVSVQIPRGYFGDLRPRSSVYKKGPWHMANSCGTIDSDYTGTLKVVFKCHSDSWSDISDPPYEIGDKIAQLILVPYSNMEFDKVLRFEEKTTRGSGSFGHTDSKRDNK